MKKIIYVALCFMLVLSSCQKEEDVITLEPTNSEQRLKNDENTVKGITITEKTSDALVACEDCEVSLKYFGGKGEVTVTDSTGNDVFSGEVESGMEYFFIINSCETYDITTQALVGDYGNVKIKDAATSYIIPATANQVTYVDYTFTCPDPTIETCEIDLCYKSTYSGSADSVTIQTYVGGVPDQTITLQEGECVTITIDENQSFGLSYTATNATPNFGFFLGIYTQSHNISLPSPYFKDPYIYTIHERFLQCKL